MKSRATARFWKLYHELPPRIQALARKNYQLWKNDHNHPSLDFKPLQGGTPRRFSIRVGDHYRAVGHLVGEAVEWVWIGSHEAYNKLIGR